MPGLSPATARRARGSILVLVLWGLTAAALASPAARPRLSGGEARTLQLRAGEVEAFEVELAAGAVLWVEADQTGADVQLRAWAPDGSVSTEVDDGVRGAVPETLFWVAAGPGVHCVEVSSAETDGPGQSVRLAVAPIRPARREDRLRALARECFERAHDAEESGEGVVTGIADGLLAASLFRDLDDPKNEGRARAFVGATYGGPNERPAAREQLERAGELNRACGDLYGEAITSNFMGVYYQRDGDGLAALPFYRRALEIMRDSHSATWEERLASNLGFLYQSIGEDEKAEASFQEALRAGARMGDDEWSMGVPLLGIGAQLHTLGEDARAVEPLQRAIAIFNRHSDTRSAAYAYGTLGWCFHAMGDWPRAVDAFLSQLTICRSLGDQFLEVSSLIYLGQTLEKLGDVTQAMDLYRQSLDLGRSLQLRGSVSLALRSLAVGLAQAGQPGLARMHLEEALDLRRQLGDVWGEVETRLEIAKLERRQGDLDCARHHIETSLMLEERMRRLAVGQEVRTQLSTAGRRTYELYLSVLMGLRAREPRAGWERVAFDASEKSRAATLLELLAEPVRKIRDSVDPQILEREKELKQRLSGLLERQARSTPAASGGDTPERREQARAIGEIQSELTSLDREIRAANARYSALTRPAASTAADVQSSLLDDDTVLIEYALGDEGSLVWAVTRGSLEVAELPKRQEIEDLAKKLYDGFASGRSASPARRKDLESLSRILLGPVAVASRLDRRRVLVVPDGALHYVPFAALLAETGAGKREPLILRHEISTAPSASVLASIRREAEGRAASPKLVAVLADPVFEADDARVGGGGPGRAMPGDADGSNASAYRSAAAAGAGGAKAGGRLRISRLPYSRRESEGILAGLPPASRLQALDFDASRETALDPKLGSFRFVHFATHGFFNNEHPDLSGLVLTLVDRQGRPTPGFLSTADVFNMTLPADLVVLSGCQTALGKESRGEGIVGLTRGFFYAGAQAVIASLWKVDDAGTAELMKHFYRGMLGPERLSPAEALRRAQLAMRRSKQWGDPAHWAAFVLQGNAAGGSRQFRNDGSH